MKILHDINVIYVFCPSYISYIQTGGVELLHQLVDYLRKHQKESYIYYYDSLLATVSMFTVNIIFPQHWK